MDKRRRVMNPSKKTGIWIYGEVTGLRSLHYAISKPPTGSAGWAADYWAFYEMYTTYNSNLVGTEIYLDHQRHDPFYYTMDNLLLVDYDRDIELNGFYNTNSQFIPCMGYDPKNWYGSDPLGVGGYQNWKLNYSEVTNIDKIKFNSMDISNPYVGNYGETNTYVSWYTGDYGMSVDYSFYVRPDAEWYKPNGGGAEYVTIHIPFNLTIFDDTFTITFESYQARVHYIVT